MGIAIAPLDLTQRIKVYDGNPEDWQQPINLPLGPSHWAFTLAEISSQSFTQLEDILGSESFQIILKTQGYTHPKTEFEGYRGADNLPLCYYTRSNPQDSTWDLILISLGEYQPMRWMAYLEGIWQVRPTR